MSSHRPPVVLKEGFLAKRSRGALTRFQRRYFRLFAGELQYFSSAQDTVPRRRIALHLDTKVTPTNDQGYERCFMIRASAATPNLYVQAEKEDEKEEWVMAIYNALRRTADVADAFDTAEMPTSSTNVRPPPSPPSTSQTTARILLHVNVVEAKGLKGANYLANAKSDPLCVVNFVGKDGNIIRSEEVKTQYITDTVDPVWNKHFTLGYAVDLATVEAIYVELIDHEYMSGNKPLGFVKVPLSVFQMSPSSMGQSELVDRWFRVEPPPEVTSMIDLVAGGSSPRKDKKEKETMLRDHGKLHLVMSVEGPNLVKFFRSLHANIVPQSRIVTDGVDHTDNRLEVTVLGAKDLIAADFNKSSDPFVELVLLDAKAKPIRGEFYRTAVKERTRNPAWQDEHYIFGRICRIEEAVQLHVRVMDWDEHSRNDPLGCVVINLDHLSAHSQTDWHALQPEPGMAITENLGFVQLRISLTGETPGERKRRQQIDEVVASKAHELSEEQRDLENAQHDLHDAACSLDGARIACSVGDYQARHPQFYGINGCIHHLNAQLPRAHRETASSDEGFQAKAGIEGQAVLDVSVLGTYQLKKVGTTMTSTNPYAVIDMDPNVCIEECKRVSAPMSPQKSKRIEKNLAATEARSGMFARRAQAEVSSHRTKIGKNEVRSERRLDPSPDQPILKVEIKSGHGLTGVDFGGYSDPYCTLTLTDRATGKGVEVEKKRTAVIMKTLNPVWENEVFVLGHNFPLSNASSLIIHVKDHNMTRSTPLGRVQIPVSDLCHASANSTSISSTAKEKRYTLMPEPWMKKHAQNLGELCVKTEVIGDATVLAEMLQRAVAEDAPGKMLSFLSMQSFGSEAHLSESGMSGVSSMSLGGYLGDEDEVTEIIEKGQAIQTSIGVGTSASWRKEKFSLSLSYPGMFSASKGEKAQRYSLRLRVIGARNLLGNAAQSSTESSVLGGKVHRHHRHHLLGRRANTNAFFTVIPVQREGQLNHKERKQSLTVYGTRNPTWPDEDFLFGKEKGFEGMSYLSLHVYSRDLDSEVSRSITELLTEDERKRVVRLKRFQLSKLAPSGIVDDDGLAILPFDQRVLAYRKCGDGGRFFPGRVQKYYAFPVDEYEVLFEDDIETIDDLWDLFSLDVEGKIESLHSDGTFDVSFKTMTGDTATTSYAQNVPASLLKPVEAFSRPIRRVMARRLDSISERSAAWDKLKHFVSGLSVDVLSATGLPKQFSKPKCAVTFIGNPRSSPTQEVCTIDSKGFLKSRDGKSFKNLRRHDQGGLLSFDLQYLADVEDLQDQKLFEEKHLAVGLPSDENGVEKEPPVEERSEAMDGKNLLAQTASLLFEVTDEGSSTNACRVVGTARIDLASLHKGAHDLSLRLLPPPDIDYYKFVGSLTIHVKCTHQTSGNVKQIVDESSESMQADKVKTVCGALKWYDSRAAAEPSSSGTLSPVSSPRLMSTVAKAKTLTRIERRQLLRSSLTPTENAQVDAFHTVLVVIMKRIVGIIREIRLFEEFEDVAAEETAKFRHVHTINKDMSSEWIGRPINELSLETRKSIVVDLEFELLDIAASKWRRVEVPNGLPRDEWVRLRTVRQQELLKVSGFFMQDRTSSVVLSIPYSFTGEGMVSWICRSPAILWQDLWEKYCHDAHTKETCKLHWNDTTCDPDAIEPPRTVEKVLLWMNTLSDAGYIENVTPSLSALDFNKKYYLVENKAASFFRLREVERWVRKESRDKSLFPLDLVAEVDCFQQVDVVPVIQAPLPKPASPKKAKETTPIVQEPEVISKADVLIAKKRTYAKKLVDHVEGFLGLPNAFSNVLFSQEIQKSSLLKPVAEKTQQFVAEKLLWDWKYSLFIPDAKKIFVFEHELSAAPIIILDMSSILCHAEYNFTYEKKGGWFNVVNATVLQASTLGDVLGKYTVISEALREKLMRVATDGSLVFEFKTSNAQLWVQSFVRAGVQVNMKPEQLVVLKRLNPTVLQRKCIDNVANFNPNDLEGSFQRMLNKFFKHNEESTREDHEHKMRELRAKMRREMKKPGKVGDAVMAYYGKGQRFNPPPTNERMFTRGALYSGQIVAVRTPFSDSKYHVTESYDVKTAPRAMQDLLAEYKVIDKQSWLKLPTWNRDVFLIYDVEYRHQHEIIREEGMLRENIRANDGDLDPLKVQERCTDINVWFKPSDLEDCVTRIVVHTGGRKPLGCLKIPVKTVSAHRTADVWYPLAPEKEMIHKAKLGFVRVQLSLTIDDQIVRSKKISSLLLDEVKEAARAAAAAKPLAMAAAAASNPLNILKDRLNKAAKFRLLSPTAANAFIVSRERSFVKIRVLEGRKMIAADVRTSDPFVKIVLVREKDDKEEFTKLKTDIKYNTLSPKWVNQEFVLGKTPETMLSDKKAVILRVMDHDLTSSDDPMGCLKVEFQRDKSQYITGLVLVHADEKGCETSRVLQLNDQMRVEVDEKVLADEKAGQSKNASARGNNASVDGKLGRLRFVVEISHNENFIDPDGVSAAQMAAMMRSLETKFSLEVNFKSITPKVASEGWKQYACVFTPKGEGGQRVHYDVHAEDLGAESKLRLNDLLASASSSHIQPRILGRSYDMSRVAYFDVELRNIVTGKVFTGRFGDKLPLGDPRKYEALVNEVLILKDKDGKDPDHQLLLDVRVVAIHRARRLNRLLAETFHLVGLDFDVRRVNDDGKLEERSDSVHRFLWEVCKAHVIRGQNSKQELMAQVLRMCDSTKLHWKYTPQLLGLVFEHVFAFGDKDRLTYEEAVTLDAMLTRWSLVLQHLNEAKKQLIGHLHGQQTPRLIHTLMSECDWTGFEFVSLPSVSEKLTQASGEVTSAAPEEVIFRAGKKVHALLPARKHSGVSVDVKLSNGQYAAGTIVAELGDDAFNVAFCTCAKVYDDDDGYFSDDEELPPLTLGQAVFLCPVAYGETLHVHGAGEANSVVLSNIGRNGRIKAIDLTDSQKPYLVEFEGAEEPKEMKAPRVWLDSKYDCVAGGDLFIQLAKDEFVRVENVDGGTRKARIVKNHRNGKYDVEYLDRKRLEPERSDGVPRAQSSLRSVEDGCFDNEVPRSRLEVYNEDVIVEAEIVRTYLSLASGAAANYVVTYDLMLKNGDFIEGVTKERLRTHEETFPSDKCVLASVFFQKLEVQDAGEVKTDVARRLDELFAHDQLVKVYVMMPAQPQQIHLRDGASSKQLQAKLKVRDAAEPRFVEQCHGYTTELPDKEVLKMTQIFETAAVLRGDQPAGKADFDAKRCLCLYMAPQPRVELHGMVKISPAKTKASWNLFSSLSALASKSKQSLLNLFQRLIRTTTSEHMALNRKERIVLMKDVQVLDGQQLNIIFEIGVPHSNRGSLERAVDVAYHDASQILQRLENLKLLAGYGSAEDIEWAFETTNPKDTAIPTLCVQFLDCEGRAHSRPSLTLELLPLDDQRLSILDTSGKTWEICLPIERILVEAQLRRHLVPYREAKIIERALKPDEGAESNPLQQQVNKRRRRDSMLLSRPTETLKVKKTSSSGRQLLVRFEKDSVETTIWEHDIKFDTLHVLVKEVTELKLDEKVGRGDFVVEVLLKSSDFQPQADEASALKTPFGMQLTEYGEICEDAAGKHYPQDSSQRLVKDTGSTDWKAVEKAPVLSFGHPAIDLERVSGLTVNVYAKDRTILVGTTEIPVSAIPVTKSGREEIESAVGGASRNKQITLAKLIMNSLKKANHAPGTFQEASEQTFGLYRNVNGHNDAVGKITLRLERTQAAKTGDRVLAKRLLNEDDAWNISAYDLLALTLMQHDNHLMRGLLATNTIVPQAQLKLLDDPIDQEYQLQKIVNVMLISHAMELIYATKSKQNGVVDSAIMMRDGSAPLSSPRLVDQMRHVLAQTKWFIEDTAAEFGIRTTGKRLPWSSDLGSIEELAAKESSREFVVMRANVSNTATRVRRTMLKLYQMYRHRLIPTLQRLYELDAAGDDIDVKAGEQLLSFFEEEVEDLDVEDQYVYRRVFQRIRLIKIAQVLKDIMHTTLLVTVMNHDQGMGDDEIGTAHIPLLDLLDRVEHENGYTLTKMRRSVHGGGVRAWNPFTNNQFSSTASQGIVLLRIKLSYSESSLLEQATMVYKLMKDKYVSQHELARRRINAAVVPAQRRRWMTIKGYLEELKTQSTSKLHWERTPVLLSLVWDIFIATDASRKGLQEEEERHLEGLAERAGEYRAIVVDVHRRWANLQPELEELLQIQAAAQIHATRTPELLEKIEREVEGLDLVLTTAFQQVRQKWNELKSALDQLVTMKERRKIHMGRAPQLLAKVTQRCSRGLNEQYAGAVSEVQFRWMAITKNDGPLNELRLTEKKGLHWRRTHELVLLLNEQCEGFAEIDAKTLDIVQKRWEQVQEWLNDVVVMQEKHQIDCEATPFILKKMHLVESKHKAVRVTSKHAVTLKKRVKSPASSPRTARSPSASASSNRRTSDPPSPRSPTSQDMDHLVDVEVDVDRLEGLAEWYAIEESKRELERIPYHRITTDYDRNDRLRYSQDGKDTRLLIMQEEMVYTARNVRAALVDRGIIPLVASYDGLSALDASVGSPSSKSASMSIPRDLLEEIDIIEKSIESVHAGENGSAALYVKWNPERVAELYRVIESLGKSDLLWKIDHAVNINRELDIPNTFSGLLLQLKLRQISTSEVEDLVRTLLVNLQKEKLKEKGVEVPSNANFTAVLSLMHRHQVKDVVLPLDTAEIQSQLQAKGLDKKGEPVFLRGMRIGTQLWNSEAGQTADPNAGTRGASTHARINTGLGIIDSKIEQLRKTLLIEALRKRNSLIKTFPVESFILSAEELAECTEVDMSGNYMTLVENFQQLLIQESYTKRLAEYAALDRCMRALLRVPQDQIVTKEDIAKSLQQLGSRHKLPLEAFTREELQEAASKGKIRTPSEEILARCPVGKNAKAMAYYAAVSHAALVFQETVRFRARIDPITQRFVDAFPYEKTSSADGMSVPKNRSRMSVKEFMVDWLFGSEESVVKIQRRLGEYHRQRLKWATAAFTLRNRWYQRGFGWCDDATKCAGVKVLLQKLLLFENANKMHMVDTEALLSEINDKCVKLRPREDAALQVLQGRYAKNLESLENLVIHAEKCVNNRKIHTEEAPALLHAVEQACVVPFGLNMYHKQAYHVVSSHWARHRARLAELVHMQRQGTFSIERTPELLTAMEFHTEGLAGADELTMEKVNEATSASSTPIEVQQRFVDKKVDEIRRGQRKQSSSLRLNLDDPHSEKDVVFEEMKEFDGSIDNNSDWQSLSPSKRVVQPLSPREKQTSWKVVTESGSYSASKQSIVLETKASMAEKRRKSSIGDDMKELLRSPSKWLMPTTEPADTIRPEVYFPQEVCIDHSHATVAPAHDAAESAAASAET